jgi:hypothetical protein
LIFKTPHGARNREGFLFPMLPDSHLKIATKIAEIAQSIITAAEMLK